MQKRISLTFFPSSNASKKMNQNLNKKKQLEQELYLKLAHNFTSTKCERYSLETCHLSKAVDIFFEKVSTNTTVRFSSYFWFGFFFPEATPHFPSLVL